MTVVSDGLVQLTRPERDDKKKFLRVRISNKSGGLTGSSLRYNGLDRGLYIPVLRDDPWEGASRSGRGVGTNVPKAKRPQDREGIGNRVRSESEKISQQ